MRERLSGSVGSSFLLSEMILLAVGRVPDPVAKDIYRIQSHQREAIPFVDRWCMIGQIDCAMAVTERDACHIPEGEHEAQFLVVHVPLNVSGWKQKE